MFSLEDEAATDVQRAGAKAAWLARGLRAGLPVLPGFVVDAAVSKPFLTAGREMLESASSGAARLRIVGMEQPAEVAELEAATAEFPEPIVVRSSSVLETGGEWSGAFTSYLDLHHGELGVGVLGCWASVFTEASVERFSAAGLEPGEAPMAVLVQPALDVALGGTARLVGEAVEIAAVKGSPAPLAQGWEPGVAARVDAAGRVDGAAALELLGADLAIEIADLMRSAHETTGATGCEWGYADGGLTVFQLTRTASVETNAAVPHVPELVGASAMRVGALVRRYPGPLGETLVLPWALALAEAPADVEAISFEAGDGRLDVLRQLADRLTAQVWGMPKSKAAMAASQTLRALRSTQPAEALGTIAGLRLPDADGVRLLLGLMESLAEEVVATGLITDPLLAWHLELSSIESALRGDPVVRRDRFGFDRWEPFTAAVITANGTAARGTPAGAGVAAGRMCRVLDSEDMEDFRPRDVVVSTHPVPNLAPLLWDASALVTTGGGPGAHLFESARALGIPAVCGIRLEPILGGDLPSVQGEWALAVDGAAGAVTAVEW